MKFYKLLPFFLAAIVLTAALPGYAQDTTKKTKAVTTPATPKNPNLTNKSYYKKPIVTPAQKLGNATPVKVPQVTPPAAPADKSLRGQYLYLLTKVYNYQQPLVSALFKNYGDTLNVTRKQLKALQATVATQTKNIDSLKSSVSTKNQTLEQSQAKADEISLLGIPFSKGTYNLIMWGLVIAFGAIAAIVIARSGSHSREAKYRIKLYNELEEEHKAYKTKANEKEKKLARELQTERNKNEELQNGKG